MREQYKRLLNLVSVVLLMLVECGLFAWVWYSYYGDNAQYFYGRRGNWVVIALYILIMFFFAKTLGGYKVGYLKISEICFAQFVAIVLSNVVEYLQLCIIAHGYAEPRPILLLTLVEVLLVVFWAYIVRRIYLALYPPHNMLFIYGERRQQELIDKINTRGDKYNISASISIQEGMDAICARMKHYEAVIIGDIPSQLRNDLVKYCYANDVRAYITPKISDIIIAGAEEINLFDTQLLLSRNYGLSGEQLMIKRMMDIVISVIGLTILSPFMLLTAICVKCYDGGPVFYTQERLTKNRKRFQILKFRSMRVDSDKASKYLTIKGDDRVTPVGKFIRRIHFDEIPQLINILKGDMSFVGPRAMWETIIDESEQVVPEFAFRLKVKAGLTGYAQVYGKYNTTPYDKLKLDLTYIEKYSVWLDIKIILMTVKAVFRSEEGFEAKQQTAAAKEPEE